MRRALGLSVGLLLAACAEDCKQGDPCDETCPAGTAPICVVKGVCSCNAVGTPSPGDGGARDVGPVADGTFIPPADCVAPMPGNLLLNEVLIDGVDEDADEFIELVNATDVPLSLAGLKVRSNSGMSLNDRVLFTGGCIAPRGAIGMYKDAAAWVFEPPIVPGAIAFTTKGFGFSNSADFTFILQDASATALDTFSGASSLIDQGYSVNRSPDGAAGGLAARHDMLAESGGRLSSPGRCANGGTFAQLCMDAPSSPDVGPNPADAGVNEAGMPIDMSPSPGDMASMPPACEAIAPGAIRINEVLVDPSGDEATGEFVELVNTTDADIRLQGVSLLSLGSDGAPDLRFTLSAGVLPARGAVAAYPSTALWVFDPPTSEAPVKSAGRFQLPNTAAIDVTLVDCNQVEIDSFAAAASLITEGTSVTRSPDLASADTPTARHDTVSMQRTSPARCLNGGRFIEGCVPPPAMP
jgi:hypothetical protein